MTYCILGAYGGILVKLGVPVFPGWNSEERSVSTTSLSFTTKAVKVSEVSLEDERNGRIMNE